MTDSSLAAGRAQKSASVSVAAAAGILGGGLLLVLLLLFAIYVHKLMQDVIVESIMCNKQFKTGQLQ